MKKYALLLTLLVLAAFRLAEADPAFTFTTIGQTIAENFNSYTGNEASLPANIFAEWDTSRTSAPFTGIGNFNTSDPTTAYGGFTSYTADNTDFSFGIRERVPVDLRDARVFLPIKNDTGEPIRYFLVSYDVEAWFIGNRRNRLRLKYDDTLGSGRFEDDLLSTDNPSSNTTPNTKVNGLLPDNRVRVEVLVDLEVYSHPNTGIFGALPDGATAWFRWQFSNADGDGGSLRSGLAINNLEITALDVPPPLQWRPGVGGSGNWQPVGGTDWSGGEWEQGRSALFADDPGTVTLTAPIDTFSIEIEADYTLSGTANEPLSAPGGVRVSDAQTATLAAVLAGAQDLLKTGPGALIVSAPQAYEGDTRVTAGSVQLGGDERLPAGAALLVTPDATFHLSQYTQTVAGLQSERYAVVNTGTGTLIVDQAANLEFRGDLIGAGHLIKRGTGRLRFRSEDKTYSGYTRIEGGVLELTANGQLKGTSSITITEDGELRLVREQGEYDFGSSIVLEGGHLAADPDEDEFGAVIYLDDHLVVQEEGGSVYVRRGQNTLEHYGNISGEGLLRKQGQGEWVILGANTSTGGLDVRNGTVLLDQFGPFSGQLGPGPLLFGSAGNMRSLINRGGDQTVTLLDGDAADPDEEESENTLTLDIGLDGMTFTVDQALMLDEDDEEETTRFQGAIIGAADFVKNGDGFLRFTRWPKTYTGATIIQQGALAVSESAALANTESITVADGGQLRLTTSGTNVTYSFGGSLHLAGLGRGGAVTEGSGQGILGALRYHPGNPDNTAAILTDVVLEDIAGLHVDGSSNSLSLNGALSGDGGFVKTGAGALILNGDTDLNGDSSVLNGSVMFEGDSSSTGVVTVAEGSVVGGLGAWGGSLHFEEGALWWFDPDGPLTVGGEVTFEQFGIEHLVNLDETTATGVYVLVEGDVDFDGLENVGIANAYPLSETLIAYFQPGSLELVVTGADEPGPEPVVVGEFVPGDGESFVASFDSEAGVGYTLEYTTDLTANPVEWNPVGGPEGSKIGDGGPMELADEFPLDDVRIYRIVTP